MRYLLLFPYETQVTGVDDTPIRDLRFKAARQAQQSLSDAGVETTMAPIIDDPVDELQHHDTILLLPLPGWTHCKRVGEYLDAGQKLGKAFMQLEMTAIVSPPMVSELKEQYTALLSFLKLYVAATKGEENEQT